MMSPPSRRSVLPLAAAIGLAGIIVLPVAAPAEPAPPQCADPSDLARFDLPLSHVAQRVATGQPIKIVAIGSSSTSGGGASSSASTYPSRLEVELRARFPGVAIRVLNRGVQGEEVPQMLARFAQAVVAEKPDLVIWQLGTNSVLRGHDIRKVSEDVRDGLGRLKAIGADVILMDLQFAPRVIEKADADSMVALIAAAAKRNHVDLFRRFAVMRDWTEARHISFQQSLAPDGLHLNDWSYGCVAKLLAAAIADAVTRAPQTAGVSTASTAHR
jgi:acyl-CoA thioesterase I